MDGHDDIMPEIDTATEGETIGMFSFVGPQQVTPKDSWGIFVVSRRQCELALYRFKL